MLKKELMIALIKDCLSVTALIDKLNDFTITTGDSSFYPKFYGGIHTIIDLFEIDLDNDDLIHRLEAEFYQLKVNTNNLNHKELAEVIYSNFMRIIQSK